MNRFEVSFSNKFYDVMTAETGKMRVEKMNLKMEKNP